LETASKKSIPTPFVSNPVRVTPFTATSGFFTNREHPVRSINKNKGNLFIKTPVAGESRKKRIPMWNPQ
jgi:hypothetical protein